MVLFAARLAGGRVSATCSECHPRARRIRIKEESGAFRFLLRLTMNRMNWTHERRLLFTQSEGWSGWFCARCCWNVPLPSRETDPTLLAPTVDEQFRYHDCYMFAAEHWKMNL